MQNHRKWLASLAGVFVFLTLIISGNQSDARSNPDEDEKAVRAVLNDQVVAWNKADLDGFMAGYWDNEKLSYISGGKAVQGFKPLKERYQKAYQADGKEMGKLVFSELTLDQLAVDVMLVRGKWQVKTQADAVEGWFTLILRKFPGGWKITHDHTSK